MNSILGLVKILLNSHKVATVCLMGGGSMFVSTDSHSVFVVFGVPETIFRAWINWSTNIVCRLNTHTGAQYSAVEYTGFNVDVLKTIAWAPQVVPASLLIILTLDLTLAATFSRWGVCFFFNSVLACLLFRWKQYDTVLLALGFRPNCLK